MSLSVNIDSLSLAVREKLVTDLTVRPELENKKYTSYTSQTPDVELFQIRNDDVIVPFAYGLNELKINKPKKENYDIISDFSFTGTLRESQKEIKDEAIKLLNSHGTCLISCYPGFGKTITSIYIASKIKLKILILTHRVVLIKQWEEAIKTFCPNASINIITPTKKNISLDFDFNIINPINVGKYGPNFFSKIGTVIVDEAHLIMSKVLSQSLQFLFPKYLIGLSATPYRSDGLSVLLDLYFTENKIVRKLQREHIVYKLNTKFKPVVELGRNGTVNWGKILESQSNDIDRNNMILNIVNTHKDRIFLILSKRIEQAKYLHSKFVEMGESVDLLIESSTKFNKDCRILISTTSKAGIGFDHARLDALILASDLEDYFIQYLGRVFRRIDVIPIIFDLVDDNPILKKHFSTRKKVYTECGGKIQNYVI